MQTVSPAFESASDLNNRFITSLLFISWLKNLDTDINFFTIGTSLIGGQDIIKGDSDDIFIFDQYDYENETDYVVEAEYEREFEVPLSGISRAQGSIILSNVNSRFTPKNDPTIGDYVELSRRPLKLRVGFKTPTVETVQVLVGYTKPPEFDFKTRRLKLKVTDALEYIYNFTFDETKVYVSERSDEVIADILDSIGFNTSQYELDEGTNYIPIVLIYPGQKAGDLLKLIAESELGHIYVDEQGKIRFNNRTNWKDKQISESIDDDQVIELKNLESDKVINSAEVTADVRELQDFQAIWQASSPIEVLGNTTVEISPSYSDPSINVVIPSSSNPTTTSFFTANSESDGTGTDMSASISLTFSDGGTSANISISNSSITTAYITEFQISGNPATITKKISVNKKDDDSILKYEERPFQVNNPYISSEEMANEITNFLIDEWAGGKNVVQLELKGKPQRQLGDLVVIESGRLGSGRLFGNIVSIIGNLVKGQFKQTIKVMGKYQENKGDNYFTIGVSTIGGSDQVAP